MSVDVKALIKSQHKRNERIRSFVVNYRKTGDDRRTGGYIQGRIQGLQECWNKFDEHHETILSHATKSELTDEYFIQDLYLETEEVYYNTLGELNDALRALSLRPGAISLANVSSEADTSIDLKLPHIKIPVFSGSYDDWQSFHGLFSSLVHLNLSLTNVQKLHYLKTSLSGEPERLLRHYQITESNYLPAWTLLQQRYNNTRLLVNTQLKKLFNQPLIKIESAKALKELLDTTNETLQSIKNLKVEITSWDPLIIHLVSHKLPRETHELWEQGINGTTTLPKYKDFASFLERRFQTLEAIDHAVSKPSTTSTEHRSRKCSSYHVAEQTMVPEKVQCAICSDNHPLRKCVKFLGLDVQQRYNLIKTKSMCINCLSKTHTLQRCRHRTRCLQCGKAHNTLLHFPAITPTIHPESTTSQARARVPDNTESNPENIHSLFVHRGTKTVLLATAVINLQSASGLWLPFRALIDPGSQSSFITESAVQRLGIKKESTVAQVIGLTATTTGTATSHTAVNIGSCYNSDFNLKIRALVFSKLTSLLPSEDIVCDQWDHVKGITLADPQFNHRQRVDVLLGADVYAAIILDGIKRGPPNTPIAQNTSLGWILFGNALNIKPHPRKILSLHNQIDNDLLRKFWEIEEVNPSKIISIEDQECEEHYKTTHKRDSSGRFILRLPFKTNLNITLGASKNAAVHRLFSMERRFSVNPNLHREYSKCLQEYLDLNQMHLCQPCLPTENEYFLPHHAVFKDSTTTKLRVVFDASSKSTSHHSLNDLLMTGPSIQQDMITILLRWRKYAIAYAADIEKMYRQIQIAPDDTKFQKIVWRFSSKDPVQEYSLCTVTFGITSAPFMAIRTLHQLAVDGKDEYPLASAAIYNDFYVDDYLSGCSSNKQAVEVYNQLTSLLKTGGFELRKWMSNSTELLSIIPEDHRELNVPLNIELDQSVKALGIHWHPSADYLCFHSSLPPQQQNYTKRSLLSDIARMFDPMGWLAPIIIKGKILVQKLWLTGLGWDEELPDQIQNEWKMIREELHLISAIRIQRWIGFDDTVSSIEFHGFCDASIHAYAAVVYSRIINGSGNVNVKLLAAKTKVSPIKTISLPRLELCGAVLLSKLLKLIQTTMRIDICNVFAWSDSTIALAWIHGKPIKWKTFVANRVAQIQENTDCNVWHHVSTKDNPADCATRSLNPSQLVAHEMWWNGPHWLLTSKETWPARSNTSIPQTSLEAKPITNFVGTTLLPSVEFNLIHTFSSLNTLTRVTAFCIRFAANCRLDQKLRIHGAIRTEEYQNAEVTLLRIVQESCFGIDLKNLRNDKPLSQKSKLKPLSPYISKDGLLRVGGRLQNAMLQYDSQHPVILPSKHHYIELLLRQTHVTNLHAGPQLMLCILRRRYWILNARSVIRRCVHQCLTCFRQNAQSLSQLMGSLPTPRVSISRPFTHCGIDYAGPVSLRVSRIRSRSPRTYKGYIAIFICLCTKAIHIEVVSDQTSDAFLAALRRFCARRGACSDIYSDNGTNFVGADRILKGIIKKNEEEASNQYACDGISWHFNPPAAPHMGGLWEAGVKSIKYHLRRVVGDALLTYEELLTVLTQVEACLNSRPLCPMSDDPTDTTALTPGHFLIGDLLVAPPDVDHGNSRTSVLKRWQLMQRMLQDFWKRWTSEYLTRLQQRPKWVSKGRELQKDDLVLIKDENLPPTKWLLGRIDELHPGKDGLARVATVKTRLSLFKRPITKICPLPPNCSHN